MCPILGGRAIAYIFAGGETFIAKFFCHDRKQNGINVIGYQVTAVTGVNVSDQDVADALSTVVAPLYKNYLAVTNAYAGLKVQVLKPVLQPAVVSLNGAGNGVNVSDPLPPQIAFLLSPRTATAGRIGRGRTYLPFWNEDQNTSNQQPTAGALTLATAWANAVFAVQTVTVGPGSVTIAPVIISRKGGFFTRIVTSVLARTEWATQRRRSNINRDDVLGP